jgi:hypothetical protein
MKALIDGDIICYSCGFAAQKSEFRISLDDKGNYKAFDTRKEADDYNSKTFGEHPAVLTQHIIPEPVENALHSAKILLNRCIKRTHADTYDVYLTGDTNFRDDLVTYYKANRDRSKKPFHYQAIKDYLITYHGAIVVSGQEADDAMAQDQWEDIVKSDGDDEECATAICTIDKDLDMIPGWHYNWRKDIVYWKTFSEAIMFFYGQLLTGDVVDNIKGVPGIGEKKAAKILAGASSELQLYRRVQETYVNYIQKTKPELATLAVFKAANTLLQENADLLWIRRVEGEAWLPPTERIKNETDSDTTSHVNDAIFYNVNSCFHGL